MTRLTSACFWSHLNCFPMNRIASAHRQFSYLYLPNLRRRPMKWKTAWDSSGGCIFQQCLYETKWWFGVKRSPQEEWSTTRIAKLFYSIRNSGTLDICNAMRSILAANFCRGFNCLICGDEIKIIKSSVIQKRFSVLVLACWHGLTLILSIADHRVRLKIGFENQMAGDGNWTKLKFSIVLQERSESLSLIWIRDRVSKPIGQKFELGKPRSVRNFQCPQSWRNQHKSKRDWFGEKA